MSTKALERVLQNAQGGISSYADALASARSELAAVRKAAKTLAQCQISYDRGVTPTKAVEEAHALIHAISKEEQ